MRDFYLLYLAIGVSVAHSKRIYFKVAITEKIIDCFSVSINMNNFFFMKRERRQALVKTNGPDDGPNSVMSLLTRSSSPLRSTIRNRNRRSSSTPDISSNKNTTMKVRPTPVNSQPPKISNSKQLIITFLDAITSPYLSIY